ncbi:MAG: hypothetical protein ACJA2W_000521 [Planctomycetota bacterium]|jgi:hypothetical protein
MMYRLSVRTAYALSASVLIAASASAQDRFATSVVQYNQGGGTGLFNTGLILGGPQGGGFSGGSLDVLTLGTGGDVTLGFDVTITNGPGADFTVFENGFVFSETVFAEVAMVEVSTDGTTFARFPTRYNGDPGPLGGFALLPYATYEGLTGGLPGLANVLTNQVDPFNPVVSGGEAFDLAELVGQAEVVSGSVDLAAIHFVRIVDVIGGTINDSTGTPIWDSGGDSGADIDAVAVIHHLGNTGPAGPTADLYLDAQGFCHFVLGDPDGISDLDLSTLSLSLDLQPLSFSQMRRVFTLQSSSPSEIHLVSQQPIAGWSVETVLAVSVNDSSGLFSADQITLHP